MNRASDIPGCDRNAGGPPLVVRDLHKRYGAVEAVRGVSFEVRRGEVFGLLGPNGAGKTTTVECVLGLRRAEAGEILIDGRPAGDWPDRGRSRFGASLQATALQDRITPREAIALFGAFYSCRLATAAVLERFGLSDKADAAFDTLSGGQRQRLALALAIVHDPPVLVLDEPTTGLDPQARRDVHALVRELRGDGRAILLTTHDLASATTLCDRVAILTAGRVVAAGTPEELVSTASAGAAIVAVRTRGPIPAEVHREFGATAGGGEEADRLEVATEDVNATVIAVMRRLGDAGAELIDLSVRRPTLEDAYLRATRG